MENNTLSPFSDEFCLKLERTLTILHGELLIKGGLYPSLEGEDIELGKPKSIAKKLVTASKNLYAFTKAVKDIVVNKIVSEKLVIERSITTTKTIQEITAQKAFVDKVPTYEVQRKRFMGLIAAADYVQGLATSGTVADLDYSLLDNIVEKSNGVLKITKPSEGSSFKNLTWTPPELTRYEIKTSRWASNSGMQEMQSLALTCKYQAVDKLTEVAKTLVKRCESARADLYGQGLTDDETDEMAKLLNTTYLIGKAIKQLIREGIEKEVNTFTIKYLGRLKKFIFV